jgi:hypothetical protein
MFSIEHVLTRVTMEELELRREGVSALPRRLQHNLLLSQLKKREIKKMKIIPRHAAPNFKKKEIKMWK